jgi:hypothetical protein
VTEQAARLPDTRRAGAGRALMRGAMWLLAAFFVLVAGWIIGSLAWPGLFFIIGFPVYALALWGVVWLVRGVLMYCVPARRM